uniref:coiled-coil domain-containing protein 14 isoform X1 n=3 Tax=Myxine glutinosa TaxID=7769 RepID=UPI00358F92FC
MTPAGRQWTKAGLKHSAKVTSTGRSMGLAKQPNMKKRTVSRMASSTSPDSGYSLHSTGSEGQVARIHRGLDRCATLLQELRLSGTTENQSGAENPANHTTVEKKKNLGVKRVAAKVRTGVAPAMQKDIVSIEDRDPSAADHNPSMGFQQQTQVAFQSECFPPVSSLNYPKPIPHSIHSQSFPARLGHEPKLAFDAPLPNHALALASPERQITSSHGQQDEQAQGCGTRLWTSSNFAQPSSLPESPPSQLHAALAPSIPVISTFDEKAVSNDRQAYTTNVPANHISSSVQQMTTDACSLLGRLQAEKPEEVAAQNVDTSWLQQCPQGRLVKALLEELKSLTGQQGCSDTRSSRLVRQLEDSIFQLTFSSSASTVEHQSLTWLRKENEELRRQLRLVNQHLSKMKPGAESEHQLRHEDSEWLSLKEEIASFRQQLLESQQEAAVERTRAEELWDSLQAVHAEVRREAEQRKAEEAHWVAGKDSCKMDAECIHQEVTDALGTMRETQLEFEAVERKNQHLQSVLGQRDQELAGLRALTRNMQSSMTALLSQLKQQNHYWDLSRRASSTPIESGQPRLTPSLLAKHNLLAKEMTVSSHMSSMVPGVHTIMQPLSDVMDCNSSNTLVQANGKAFEEISYLLPAGAHPLKNNEGNPVKQGDLDHKTDWLPLGEGPSGVGDGLPGSADVAVEGVPSEFCQPSWKMQRTTNLDAYESVSECNAIGLAQEDQFSTRGPNWSFSSMLCPSEATDITGATGITASTYTSRDDRNFRADVVALNADIARVQSTLHHSSDKVPSGPTA